jgi:hypothetical protein
VKWIQVGSGWGPVAGSCEHGDEPSDSSATELVSYASNLEPFITCIIPPPGGQTVCIQFGHAPADHRLDYQHNCVVG